MSSAPSPSVRYETPHAERLDRLASLQATDPGVFVLAVHSFVEGVIRERISLEPGDPDWFSALIDRYSECCRKKLGGPHPSLAVLGLLRNAHEPTNAVRHNFAALDVTRAREATQQLRRFCQVAGIDCPQELAKLERYLLAWDERKAAGALREELEAIRRALGAIGASGSSLHERIAELDRAEREARHYREELRARERAIEELTRRAADKDGKVDGLRNERNRFKEEARRLRAERDDLAAGLREAEERAAREGEARAYREALLAATTYTRTRADYEKTIIRLTPEQKTILRQIRLDTDFLVKGAAGTGKTLVLLEAIRKAKGRGDQVELGLEELSGSIALLTYTRALTKYDRYLARLLDLDAGDRIQTALSFLTERFHRLAPGAAVELRLQDEDAAPFCPGFMSPREFAAEADNFIWANLLTEEEYVDESFPRRGMRKPLQARQREVVWLAVEALEADRRGKRRYTQNLAARDLVFASRAGASFQDVDHVFVDETQDLSAAMLAAIKASTRRSLVLAGDGDQSIYQPFTSFERADIDIKGHTRVLHTNFRNTVQLHDYAERYRALGASRGSPIDAESQPEAFREGPEPELFEGRDAQELLDLVTGHVGLYVGTLGYDPDNIAILAPTNHDLDVLAERLDAAGYASSQIHHDGFDFDERGKVRLCTLHSAKGLDFPVVFLWIPKLHIVDDSWEAAAEDRMNRNLLYVGLTRAMDHCAVFVKAGLETEAVKDLLAAKG
jgi:hypothetical protein